jgi:hypothetical protein
VRLLPSRVNLSASVEGRVWYALAAGTFGVRGS